ncbi:MAG: hypothetical protein R3272_16165 [Candidatus Promineifilaceae bacterium]|nr:hypothetical protein [Candidatus Promineifilaceae bacterium]
MEIVELWWLSLAIAAVVVVVVAVLLGLIIAAAKRIDQHAEDIWIVGKQIAGNTVSIWMLEQTKQEVNTIRRNVESLTDTARAIDERLQKLS